VQVPRLDRLAGLDTACNALDLRERSLQSLLSHAFTEVLPIELARCEQRDRLLGDIGVSACDELVQAVDENIGH
jgi:hypothetical protein